MYNMKISRINNWVLEKQNKSVRLQHNFSLKYVSQDVIGF